MVAYASVIMIAAIFCQGVSTLAEIDADWQTTPFVECMQNACGEYPNSVCSQTTVLDCHNSANSRKEKRTTIDMQVVLSSPEGALEVRQYSGFTTDSDPECDQTTLPKNLLVVTDVRADAQAWCQALKTDLLAKGVGYISQNLSTAVTKSANELHGKKSVMLSLILAAYPPALTGFTALQNADTLVTNACTAALVALATKGTGCTADINWYNAGKAKGETSTGAIPGTINIANQAVDWMLLTARYLKPSDDA